jgi:hypothetical protein
MSKPTFWPEVDMRDLEEAPGGFLRCQNLQEVPESVCLGCLHTLIAPTIQSLELQERDHNRECQEPRLRLSQASEVWLLNLASIGRYQWRHAKALFSVFNLS